MKKEYINYISEHQLTNVFFFDFMNKELLFKYYQISDLFVLPTREDIWGLVINEAMANGLPIITTDKCVAGKELINDNGYIISSFIWIDFLYRIIKTCSKRKDNRGNKVYAYCNNERYIKY